MELGRVGIWSMQLGRMPAAAARRAAAGIERLGFRALWYPETVVTKEAMAHAAVLLSATSEMVVATGIANIWARDPVAMMNGARTLAEAFPARFALGIGVGHAPSATRRGHVYRQPFSTLAAYLEAMRQAPYQGAEPEPPPPIFLAALGPRMLQLAGERADGAHPYFVPVEHTAQARSVLGPGAILAPEQAVALASDASEGRALARAHMGHYLVLENYRKNLLRLGWAEADLAGEACDAVVDAVVAWGGVEAIQARVAAHLAAGADHVSVQVLNGAPDEFPMEELQRLAPALLEL